MMSVLDPGLNRRVSLRYALLLLPLCSVALPLAGSGVDVLSWLGLGGGAAGASEALTATSAAAGPIVEPWAYALLSAPINAVMIHAAYKFWRHGTDQAARWCFWVSLVHLPAIMLLAMACKREMWNGVGEALGMGTTRVPAAAVGRMGGQGRGLLFRYSDEFLKDEPRRIPAMEGDAFFFRAHYLPFAALGFYALIILALLTPFFQNHFVFLHSVNFPFYANFSNPERYGIAPGKARNIRLTASDGVSLGAWHLVPMHANVVAIDYRGFGDSKSPGVHPSEDGLLLDARAAWDWVVSKNSASSAAGEPNSNIILMGQSLGTGVVSQLALTVTQEGQPPQAAVLIAPYASLRSLVLDYRLGGVIPVMGPLRRVPGIDTLIDNFLITQFNSTDALLRLYHGHDSLEVDGHIPSLRTVPHLVVVHATSDDVIPFAHSEFLFDALKSSEQSRASSTAKDANIQEHDIDGFGRVIHLDLENTLTPQAQAGGVDGGQWDSHRESSATVNLIRTHWGGHNTGFSEGVADFVRQLVGWTPDGLK
ncbi:hypothetical protein OC834_006435 [Tilletia horrida]|nr:hypothetical protein OC834_006435 [Tilletia horrida]